MWSAPSQVDAAPLAHGLGQSFFEIFPEQEQDFLTESDEYQRYRDLPEDLEAYADWAPNWILDQELAACGPVTSLPSSMSEITEALSPHRHQQHPAPAPEASPPRPSPPIPPSTSISPSPPHPGAWDRGRACVVNATNTYWSYGGTHGCSQDLKGSFVDGERVYMKQADGSLRWAVLQQMARSTLAAKSRLDQMVEAVGGDPSSFATRLDKADYVLAREAPIDVLRKEDEDEMSSVSFPVYLGQPASSCFWGEGKLSNYTLIMSASTQVDMERFL